MLVSAPLHLLDSAQTPREESVGSPGKPRPAEGLEGEQFADTKLLQRELSLSEDRYRRVQAQMENERHQHNEDVQFLKDKLSESQKTCEDLRSQLSCLDFILRADDGSKAREVQDQQKRISELEDRLNDKKWIGAFSSLSSINPKKLDARSVQADMDLIKSSIEQIMCEDEDHEAHIPPNIGCLDDLKSLLYRIVHLDLSEPYNQLRQSINSTGLSFQALIRALTASALCEWVFEPRLQGITLEPCTLLKEYRKRLAKIGIPALAYVLTLFLLTCEKTPKSWGILISQSTGR
jgi:hypothetical protein